MIKNDKITDYYRDIDFSIWSKSGNIFFDKLNKLKTSRARSPWALKMYTNYLQLIEVFCINVFIITENDIINNAFIGNYNLRNKVKSMFLNNSIVNKDGMDFISFFLDSWVFGIKQKEKIKNFEEKKRHYKIMIMEAINDYLNDYRLLNAYKHGFRLMSLGDNSISIMKSESESSKLVSEYNTKIVYYSKDNEEIYESHLSFNWERTRLKYIFLINMIENVKTVLMAKGHEINIKSIYLSDSEMNKYKGIVRMSRYRKGSTLYRKHLKE